MLNGFCVQFRSGVIVWRGRYTGGKHKINFQRGVLRGAEHKADTVPAANVCNFVWVGNDGGNTLGQDGSCVFIRGHKA